MAEETALESAVVVPEEGREIRRLMVLFAVLYVVEGLGQTGGLIAQPLSYFLKTVEGWTPVQVTAYSSIFILPWIIKPVFGVFSDFIPFFGYRRKAYILLANAAAAAAYCAIIWLVRPSALAKALMITAFGMAISSTLAGAVLVENGHRYRSSDAFVNQQWLWFSIAQLAVGILGGELVQRLSPGAALRGAAAIIAVFPLAAVVASLFLIQEERAPINFAELKRTFTGLVAAFKGKELWLIAIFLFLYYFSPGFGTPLYYYMTDGLKFSQLYIGILGTIGSAGWIVGALCYRRFMKGLSSRTLLNLSILFGVVTTVAFVWLKGEISAAVISFVAGSAGVISFVATLSLAADFCPERAEGFVFAALMSIVNFSSTASSNLGSYLYEHAFRSRLTPLILLSAAATALIFVFVPMLRLGKKEAGAPAPSVALSEEAPASPE
jgi:BT1 family